MEDWLYDSVMGFLHSPLWKVPVNDFIDSNCIVFDTEDENKFGYTEVHQNFRSLIERLLAQHLQELGISDEQFSLACQRGGESRDVRDMLHYLLMMDDFTCFKKMMVNRNLELESEVRRHLEANTRLVAQPQPVPVAVGIPVSALPIASAPPIDDEEDDEELQAVLRMSREEHDRELRAIEERSAKLQTEMAAALSLALQAQVEALSQTVPSAPLTESPAMKPQPSREYQLYNTSSTMLDDAAETAAAQAETFAADPPSPKATNVMASEPLTPVTPAAHAPATEAASVVVAETPAPPSPKSVATPTPAAAPTTQPAAAEPTVSVPSAVDQPSTATATAPPAAVAPAKRDSLSSLPPIQPKSAPKMESAEDADMHRKLLESRARLSGQAQFPSKSVLGSGATVNISATGVTTVPAASADPPVAVPAVQRTAVPVASVPIATKPRASVKFAGVPTSPTQPDTAAAEQQQQRPAAPPQPTGPPDEVDIKRRAEYLRKQRDLLVQKQMQDRQKEVDEYNAAQAAAAAKVDGGSAKPDAALTSTDPDAARRAMRMALMQKMKTDLKQ